MLVMLGPENVIMSEDIVFAGQGLTAVVQDLMPFTSYDFIVRACTAGGGCGSSEPSSVMTLEAPPTFQTRPNVSTLTAMSLLVEWEEPEEPNGIVVTYEIRRREAPFQGEGMFQVNVSGSQSAMVDDLLPFTEYEFSVTSYTNGGGRTSEWTRGRTSEAGQLI